MWTIASNGGDAQLLAQMFLFSVMIGLNYKLSPPTAWEILDKKKSMYPLSFGVNEPYTNSLSRVIDHIITCNCYISIELSLIFTDGIIRVI